MKKYIFSLVCLCCTLLPALEGQAHEYPNHPELRKSDANIVGHILDKNTKEHLPYITVALKSTTIGTVTDATGHYFLKNLPEGNFVLEIFFQCAPFLQRHIPSDGFIPHRTDVCSSDLGQATMRSTSRQAKRCISSFFVCYSFSISIHMDRQIMPYITVALKGTTIGTVTDATGHYFLKNLLPMCALSSASHSV